MHALAAEAPKKQQQTRRVEHDAVRLPWVTFGLVDIFEKILDCKQRPGAMFNHGNNSNTQTEYRDAREDVSGQQEVLETRLVIALDYGTTFTGM